MRELRLLILLLTISLALFSCTKEGPQGPAGENGSNGKDGTNGKDGNANVVSGTVVLDNSRFVSDYWSIRLNNVTLSSPAKSATISLPAITQSIYQTGTVLVYMKTPSGATRASWIPLPYSRPGNPSGYLIVTNYLYEPGTLRIFYYHQLTDNALAGGMPIASDAVVPTQEYKYVIIAGNAAANSVVKPPVDRFAFPD